MNVLARRSAKNLGRVQAALVPDAGDGLLATPEPIASIAFPDRRSSFRSDRRGVRLLLFVLATSALGNLLFLDPRAVEGGRRSSLVLYGLCVATALAVALLRSSQRGASHFISKHSTRHVDHALLILLILSAAALIVGFVRGNSLNYMLGDVYDVAILALGYGLGSAVLGRSHDTDRAGDVLLRQLAWILAAMQARDFLTGVLALSDGSLNRLNSVLWMHNLVGVAACSTICVSTSRSHERKIYSGLIVFLIAAGGMSAFRTYLLLLPIAIAGPVLLVRSAGLGQRIGRSIRAILAGALIACLMLALPPIGEAAARSWSTLTRRLAQSTSSEGEDGRAIEIESVLDAAAGNNDAIIVGSGLGATITLPDRASEYALTMVDEDGRKHFVHNIFAAVFLRYGLIGLAALTYFFWAILRQASRLLRKVPSPFAGFVVVVVVLYVANAPLFGEMIGDVVFALTLGMSSGLVRARASG